MTDNITVSRETLRAELAGMELRLVDRLSESLKGKADHATMVAAVSRIDSLELSRASREHMVDDISNMNTRVARLERFRYAVPSVAVMGLLVTVLTLIFSGHSL
jgi:hypothetical protein